MSLEKFSMLSLTDQDSAEKQIRKMEEKQISDKEVENISTENTPKKERTVSPPFLPSYTKSYCQTHIESTILEHTWKIDQFIHFSTIKNVITFPSFLEIGQCEVLMSISRQDSSQINAIKCYILTNNSFGGSCTTTITQRHYYAERHYDKLLSSNFISGHVSNMTLLIELSTERFSFERTGALIVHCKFEIFHNLINKTIRMNLLPSTEVSKDVICSEDSTFDEFWSRDEDSIKFIVGKEQYVLSRKLLCDSDSRYFKYICKHKEKVKDMTNELVTDNEVESFKQILLYITTGSIEQRYHNTLINLLTAADKYDVPSLKLMCEHYLLHDIMIENAVELLLFALSLNAKFLETHSATFIKFHIKEIMDTKTFKSLSREDSNKIMELIKKSKFDVSTHKFLSPLTTDEIFTLANNPDNRETFTII